MCHYSEFHKITYVNCRRNDLQNDVKFSLGKCFLATQETLQSSTRKTQNHVICRLRDQRVKEHSCILNDSKSYMRTFSEMKWKFLVHSSLQLEVLARTTDKTVVNYLRWFPWCRAIRIYRVIKVLGVLPELRTRVNLTLPKQVFFT